MPDAGENYCGYFVKLIGLGVAVGGVICSWLTIGSCQFISFVDTDGNPPEDAEDPPFNNALEADVGIFKYRINKYFTDPDGGGTDCRDYDDKFTQQTAYPSLATAQFCTMMAPILAGVGMLITLLDICACRFSACYIVSTLFFLCAAGLQAGAFTLVADPAFCFEDSELECSTERGAIVNGIAAVLYFLSAVIVCCAPQGDPFCYNFGQSTSDSDGRKGGRTTTVIVQPVPRKDDDDSYN